MDALKEAIRAEVRAAIQEAFSPNTPASVASPPEELWIGWRSPSQWGWHLVSNGQTYGLAYWATSPIGHWDSAIWPAGIPDPLKIIKVWRNLPNLPCGV